jgi:MFS family permease
VVSRFARLARTHVFSVAGDTLVTIALAGSIFFSVDADSARGRVALYLALTLAPFAIVAPLIGPAIDRARGGRRLMVFVTALGRLAVAILMARSLDSLYLFPLAFLALTLGKGYHVAKSALVPSLVNKEEELVEANSKLVLISGLAGAAAGVFGGILSLIGSEAVLVFAAISFAICTVLSLKLPQEAVATEPMGEEERNELRSAGILLAASATALLRGIVGFLVFVLAFWLKETDTATIWFGLMLAASMLGNFAGALIAPWLRRSVREERILTGVLVLTAAVALGAAVFGGLVAATALAMAVGFAAGLGKLAFDAIVQRDAPDANQGRSFARFETRFQLVWVVGALIPVLVPTSIMPVRVAFFAVMLTAVFAAVTYAGGMRAAARGEDTPTEWIKARMFSAGVKERLRTARRRSASPERPEVTPPPPSLPARRPPGPEGDQGSLFPNDP